MKTLFKTLLIVGLALVLGAMLLGWGVLHLLGDAPGVHLTIDGDEVIWSGIGMADAFGAGLGMIIAIGVMCLVVPLVLLLGLGLPLLILGALALAGLAALLGVGVVAGSPLLLIGFIVWLLVRARRPRAVTPPPSAPAAPSEPVLHA
jgi:hypothetical protein